MLAVLSLMMEEWATRVSTVLSVRWEKSRCGFSSSSMKLLPNMVETMSLMTGGKADGVRRGAETRGTEAAPRRAEARTSPPVVLRPHS